MEALMPQIEEAQFVNWGSMRPDIIPLAAPGITMAVGPNGSGKSCWLDGLKIILGVSDLSGRRTPASYIFNGGPSGLPAEQAWLRATFANPMRAGRRGRVFANAGSGCEVAEHVTVICRIRGDRRQYAVLPGRIAWGLDNHQIDADLLSLQNAIPESKWLGPQIYDRILTRAGVTKALRGVLALPQGETNRLVAETPTGLMRRLLELTGRQDTLDKFRLARTKHGEATIAHRDAQRKFELKKIEVEQLRIQVRQHRDFVRDRTRLVDIDHRLLPAALHYECIEALDEIKDLIAKKKRERDLRKNELTHLHDVCGDLSQDLYRASENARVATEHCTRLADDLSEAHEMYGRSRERAAAAWRALDEARTAAGATSLSEVDQAVEAAEAALSAARQRYRHLVLASVQSRTDNDRLSIGGSLAPPEVRAFQEHLRSAGISSVIVGDVLAEAADNDEHADHAQVALGDAMWALVVPHSGYRAACDHAEQAGYRWPLAREGAGTPRGVLNLGPQQTLGRMLEALDAVAANDTEDIEQLRATGTPATHNGMRHDVAMSRLTSAQDKILHPRARITALTRLSLAATDADREQAALKAKLPQLRTALITAYSTQSLLHRLEDTRQAFRTASREHAYIHLGRRWLQEEHSEAKRIEADAASQVDAKKAAIADQRLQSRTLAEAIGSINAELQRLEEQRLNVELKLDERPLPTGFSATDVGSLEPAPNLKAERDRLQNAVEDPERYPADVKDPVIIDQLDAEKDRLDGVAGLIDGRDRELKERAQVVEASRRQYDDHIKALVRELKNRFVEICATAGIEGTIQLIPGDVQDEYGVDVLVSHKAGEPPLSYRDGSHSGGQGTKIAILLLLAAMSLGQNADLLIVDEHKAHLDGTNSSQITDIMRSLATRVQFVLSAPTVPKYDKNEADWCDIQVTFLPRNSGEIHSPPARLMSRLDAAHLAHRFESLQQPLALASALR
jgi:chromosome segregation ATPase